MAFLTKKTTMLFKIESSPYTFEQPAATDALPCENIEFKPEVPVKEQKLARGDFSRDKSVSGTRSATLSFDVPIYYSGIASTVPKYFDLLRGCGLKQVAHTTTGVSLITDAAYTAVPISFQIQMMDEGGSPTIYTAKLSGCMGNAKFVSGKVGEYAKVSFEFKGVIYSFSDVAFASYIAPSFSAYAPDVMLGVGVTLNSVGQCVSNFTIDLGNTVELFSCATFASGFQGAHVVDRNPTIEMDADLKSLATENDYNNVINNTTMAFLAQMTGPVVFSAPAAQLVQAPQFAEREGHYVNNKKLELKRSSGNDELEIIHGSKT